MRIHHHSELHAIPQFHLANVHGLGAVVQMHQLRRLLVHLDDNVIPLVGKLAGELLVGGVLHV